MEQTVRLLDGLGERHGAVHRYSNLRSPADAIKLLCLNSPAFQKELIEAHNDGVGYQVVQGGRAIEAYDELGLPFGSKDLYIVPVIIGSGGSVGKSLGFIALGVGLIAFSIITAGAGAGFMGLGMGGGFLGPLANVGIATQMFAGANVVSSIVGGVGLAMAIQGVTSLVAPQPQLPKPTGLRRLETRGGAAGDNLRASGVRSVSRATNQEQSYLYTGARNTSGPGAIVPVVFGKALIGSHLLSLDVIVQDTMSSSYVTQVTSGGINEVAIHGDYLKNEYEIMGGVLRSRMIKDGDLTPHNNRPEIEVSDIDASDGGPKYHQLVKQDTIITLNDTNQESVIGVPHNLKKNRGFGTEDSDKHQWKKRNWEIVFRLPNGLFDFVSPNATNGNEKPSGEGKQPGFIDYTIELIADGLYNRPDTPIASAQASVTAQLDASYPSDGFSDGFTWVHSFSYGDVANIIQDGNDTINDNFHIKPVLTINRFRCPGNYFKLEVVQTGYKNVIASAPWTKTSAGEHIEHDSAGKMEYRARVASFDFR